jgi:hypothetical protein
MNEAWKTADADAHHAKAEAIAHAINTLDGLDGALDAVETPVIHNAVALLVVARERHETAAKLLAVV